MRIDVSIFNLMRTKLASNHCRCSATDSAASPATSTAATKLLQQPVQTLSMSLSEHAAKARCLVHEMPNA
jgi:hypothetical protein